MLPLDKPVLSATSDEDFILEEAVAEVIEGDKLIPADKKKEAIDYTVKMIKEGFESAKTTHGQLVASVEAEAAKQPNPMNETAGPSDRSWYDPYYSYGYGYPYSSYYSPYGYGYYPGYYSGFGYRNCNYYYPYGYCQRMLYGGKIYAILWKMKAELN